MTPEHRRILESQGWHVFAYPLSRLERTNPNNFPACVADAYGNYWLYVTPAVTDSVAKLWRPA